MSTSRYLTLPCPQYGEGAMVVISGQKRDDYQPVGWKWHSKKTDMDYYPESHLRTNAIVSFCWNAGKVAAEWDGASGPIQLWFSEPGDLDHDPIDPHWIFPKAWGYGCSTQIAVNEMQLPEAFHYGEYQRIFNTLRHWAESRQEELDR